MQSMPTLIFNIWRLVVIFTPEIVLMAADYKGLCYCVTREEDEKLL
jgi:hypothetical protein